MHCKHISFYPGDFVLLSTKHLLFKLPISLKLEPLWVGPYKIVHACSDNGYELELPAMLAKLQPVLNTTLPKFYVGDVVPVLDPVKLEDSPEYKVDAILCH